MFSTFYDRIHHFHPPVHILYGFLPAKSYSVNSKTPFSADQICPEYTARYPRNYVSVELQSICPDSKVFQDADMSCSFRHTSSAHILWPHGPHKQQAYCRPRSVVAAPLHTESMPYVPPHVCSHPTDKRLGRNPDRLFFPFHQTAELSAWFSSVLHPYPEQHLPLRYGSYPG